MENRKFLPHFAVLPVFMIYGTVHKLAVGENNRCEFRLSNKKIQSFKCCFSIFEAQLQFYREIKLKTKSQNFDDF